MWNRLEIFSEPTLSNDPLLLVSVSTSIPQYRILYSQARELANYLLDKVDFRLFASLYSSAMPPAVGIEKDGLVELVKVNFYHFGGTRDVVLFAGFSSPSSGEYEYGGEVLSYAKKLGIKDVVSIGPRWTDSPVSPYDTPEAYGYSTDLQGVEWLEQNGVKVQRNESAFYFANLITGMAPIYGMRGYKLSVNHGEPMPHPKSTMSFLRVLSKFGINAETSELEAQAKELAEGLRKAGVSTVAGGEVMSDEADDEPFYAGEDEGEEGSSSTGTSTPYR